MKRLNEQWWEASKSLEKQVKKIPSSFKQHHSSIEWRNMARMRDRLIHNYMGVDFTIDWDVLKTRIPILHLQIETLLGEID